MTAAVNCRPRRLPILVVAMTVAIAVTACGVPTGGDTRVIETQSVPYGLLRDGQHSPTGSTRVTTDPGQIRGQIALIDGDSAVHLVERDVATGAPVTIAEALLQELQRGPSDTERRSGLESAVSAGVTLQVTAWRRGILSVDVSGEANPASDRLPLAVAQIVLTATSVPGVRAVLFEHDDTTVQVPLVDGSLTSAALTRQNYQHLLQPTPSPSTSG